jgi:hypothetical protein
VGTDALRAPVGALGVTLEIEAEATEATLQFARLLLWLGQLPIRQSTAAVLRARLEVTRDDVIAALRNP